MLILGKDLQIGQFVYLPIGPNGLEKCQSIEEVMDLESKCCVTQRTGKLMLVEIKDSELWPVGPNTPYYTEFVEELNASAQALREIVNTKTRFSLAFLDGIDAKAKSLFTER